ncbi:MAG: UBA/TS-N domain protein [Eubacteriales bacterium]|nr:UBA/TS-N domain protein [Lachnospiraceae bacterium]MDO5128065.1 UBA/TS-N domain protein [Eubacteriales bacterium]
MENLEKVEKIRQKTGVSYEDAKNALVACDYDMLDAIVYLEKLGKIKAPERASYSTEMVVASQEFEQAQATYESSCKKTSVGDCVDRFIRWFGEVLKKSCKNTFHVEHEGKQVVAVPVLVFVLLLIFAFWITLPLLIVGLFFDYKYHFEGVTKVTVDVNDVCDKASAACMNIKNDVKNDTNNDTNNIA